MLRGPTRLNSDLEDAHAKKEGREIDGTAATLCGIMKNPDIEIGLVSMFLSYRTGSRIQECLLKRSAADQAKYDMQGLKEFRTENISWKIQISPGQAYVFQFAWQRTPVVFTAIHTSCKVKLYSREESLIVDVASDASKSTFLISWHSRKLENHEISTHLQSTRWFFKRIPWNGRS